MKLETFGSFEDFELLDSGNGYRLERWGEVILQRGVGGPAGSQPNHIGGDVGVAVTVTADP